MEQIGQRDDSSDRVDRCPQMRIFSGPLSMFGAKVEIAGREKGIAFELIMVPFDMKRRYEPVLRIAAEVLRLRRLPENHRKSDAELSTLAQAMM
jgi:hypothetical protein